MEGRRSRSLHLLVNPTLMVTPLGYRPVSTGWHERGRPRSISGNRRARHHYVGGVRTTLIGADSYPNLSRSPCRLILCGAGGSFEKTTTSSSTFELSRAGVYSSREDLSRSTAAMGAQHRRATSCEDVFRSTGITTTTKNATMVSIAATKPTSWDSRLSESGVSLSDSRTDLGSFMGLDDADAASQWSFGSSSAFHEITGDSEMDRPDSDCLSVPGSGYDFRTRSRDRAGGGGGGAGGGRRGGGGEGRKSRHDSGSREKFLAELTAFSGRSSPSREEDKEFYHSTPTKRGSPVLSIFPGDEENLHFHSPFPRSLTQSSVDSFLLSPSSHPLNDSLPDSAIDLSAESLPASPKSQEPGRTRKARATKSSSAADFLDEVEDDSDPTDAVREALRRRRLQFFASFGSSPSLQVDGSTLEEPQSAGESVQSWLTTGHPQRLAALTTLSASSSSPFAPELGGQADEDASDHQDEDYHHQQEEEDEQEQKQQQQQLSSQQLDPPPLPLQPPPSAKERRSSVRERVRAIEQGQDSWCQTNVPDTTITTTTTTTIKQTGRGDEGQTGAGRRHERHGAVSTTRQKQLALIQGGGALPQQQLYPPPPPSSSSPTTEAAPLLHSAPHPPPSIGDGKNEEASSTEGSSATTITTTTPHREQQCVTHHSGFTNEAGFPGGQTPQILAPTFEGDDLRKDTERQPRVGGESETVSELRGKNKEEEEEEGGRDSGTRLQVITAGPVTTAAEGPDYRPVVRGDDRRANNTGAGTTATNNTNTTQRQLLASADAAVTALSDVSLTAGSEGAGGALNVLPEHSDTLADASGYEKAGKDGGGGGVDTERGEGGQDTSPLYHARPIHIVPRDDDDDDDDDVDAEVGSVLNTPAVFSDWRQDQHSPTTDMDARNRIRHVELTCDPGAALGVMTVQEVSQRLERHVHHKRTTVQETVTTRRTSVRYHTGSPTTVADDDTAARDDRNFEMTDKTVSRVTVTEQDNERDETTTRRTIRRPVSALDTNNRIHSTEHSYSTIHGPEDNATMHDGPRLSSKFTDTGHAQILSRKGQAQSENGCRILDDLQEQLSVLSSQDPSFDTGASSSYTFRQPVAYEDHAESSLPQKAEERGSSNGVARGTRSVFITLDRTGEGPGSDVPDSCTTDAVATDWRTDGLRGQGSATSLYHAEAIQIPPEGDEGVPSQHGEGRDISAPFCHPAHSSPWSLAGSSSEINDSDDRCTFVSSHSHPYTDSEGEGRREEDAAASMHTFQDFLSGMQGQFTSDLPTLHRSVDMMEMEEGEEVFPTHLLRPPFFHEIILEADDENESTDEDVAIPAIHSFKSSLHFCVPESTTATSQVLAVSSVPQMKQQSKRLVDGMKNTTAAEDRVDMLTSLQALHELSDRLTTINDDVSRERHNDEDESGPLHDRDPSVSHLSDRGTLSPSPFPSHTGEESSVYPPSVSAQNGSTSHKASDSTSTSRRSSLTLQRGHKKAQWVHDKLLLFQKLLNDFESQSKSSEQRLVEEMVAVDAGWSWEEDCSGDSRSAKLGKQSEVCDDLYRLFSREHLELRQSHVCPVIEDHLPAFRFKRFLRKKHNSKLKGHRTFRLRHQLEGLAEQSQDDGDRESVSIYHRILSPGKLRGRYVSDVFITDDAAVNRSILSDSAYSSLSGLSSSRNLSDLDSTFRSVTGSRADVHSIATDVSMDEEKMRSMSDVFDHLDMLEGDVDEARLDRLQVGHTKAGTL